MMIIILLSLSLSLSADEMMVVCNMKWAAFVRLSVDTDSYIFKLTPSYRELNPLVAQGVYSSTNRKIAAASAVYRHKLRLVSYIIHNEKLSNFPLLIARARLQVLLGSVNTSIKLNSFTLMSLVYDMRNVASPVFTRSHSKSVKFIQANISLWFTHNGCFPRRRWDEELCTESMPDASMELRH